MNMCLIMNGYRDRGVGSSRPNYVRFFFVGLDEERSLQTKGGYTRRIARSHFELCCPHKELKINSDEQHAIFAHEVQSSLSFTVVFSHIYCEL